MYIRKINSVDEYKDFINRENSINIVKLSATWCHPCVILSDKIQSMDTIDNVEFGEIDVDDEEFDELCQTLNIKNIPVLVFYKNGNEVDRTVGFVNNSTIIDIIEKNVVA